MKKEDVIKLSVIIPVFNVESYLSACIDSILAQSIINSIEIICIDDGSTDNSKLILDNYNNMFECVSVINSVKRGPSYSRNLGIAQARGRYITFLDSDDLVAHRETYKNLITKMEDLDLQVLSGTYLRLSNGKLSNIDALTLRAN